MSDTQQVQQPSTTAAVAATALTAVLVGEVAALQANMIRRFAALITKYGVGWVLLPKLRLVASDTAAVLRRDTPSMVARVISAAASEGVTAAAKDAAQASGAGGGSDTPTGLLFRFAGDTHESHAERSARAIREDLENKLNGLAYRITRYADDVYRAVVADAATSQVLGLTPARAQHDAYQKLIANGVDGFTDSKGRNWELSAYVDMAVRTAAERAFNVSHLDRMQQLGIDLFTVPDDGHPCPLCQPWQGKILSVLPDDRADATIADATAAGLFHPRCRHVLVGYVPGVTSIPAPRPWSADDQRRYDESQQQRALERRIRDAKRQLDGAYTPEMVQAANVKVRRAQANMRAFLAQTGRTRNSRREQLHL